MQATTHTARRISSSALILVVLICGSAISAGAAAGWGRAGTVPHSVYTPVALRRVLMRVPAAWLGRDVWVWARPIQTFAWTCRHDELCVVRQPSLADPAVDAADARLPLTLPAATPVLVWVRHAPFVGSVMARLAPEPTIRWGTVGLYQIRLVAPPSCVDATCMVAQLAAVG